MTHWPAEWAEHACTWMAWPERKAIWPKMDDAYKVYAAVANTVSDYEKVRLLVSGEKITHAKKRLSSAIDLIEAPIDDSWARDTLALLVKDDSKLRAKNWRFNAWGEKFHPFNKDAALGEWLAKREGWSVDTLGMVLEGGAIHGDGEGTLLTTQECLLHPNRNPSMSKIEIEDQLLEHLSAERIIWIPHGIAGDVDTDGHIDNVACFAAKGRVLIQSCYDDNDENAARHRENIAALQAAKMAIIEVPQADKRSDYNKQRIPLSYINFYLCNDALIMPQFGQKKHDANAKSILQDAFADRRIEQIPALDLVAGGGGIHCITMQQPL